MFNVSKQYVMGQYKLQYLNDIIFLLAKNKSFGFTKKCSTKWFNILAQIKLSLDPTIKYFNEKIVLICKWG